MIAPASGSALDATASEPGVVVSWRSDGRTPSVAHPIGADLLRKGVTIVVCTYLRPNAVSRFLDSALSQLHDISEILIVATRRCG